MAEALRIIDPQECADRLVELALRGGGPDNVTVIVADVVNARPGDVIDDVPVRDGAFVDPAAAEASPTDSAAERAAAMARPPRPAAETEPTKRKGRWKMPAVILGILVLIFAALGGTYAWAQTQYYVGRAGNEVAIYQGVNASFGPIKFSEVYRNTDLKLSDLNPAFRSQVESGITASSKSDAIRIVQRLHHETKPPCPTGTPTLSPSTSNTSTTLTSGTSRSPSPSSSKSGSKSSSHPARTTAHNTPRPPAHSSPHTKSAVSTTRVPVSTKHPAKSASSAVSRATSSATSVVSSATNTTPTSSPSAPATTGSSSSGGSTSPSPSGSSSPGCR
jgi:protein phosphatase